MLLRLSAAVLLGALLTAPAAIAEQKPHVHGHWQMNAAIDGDHLQIELIAPGADVVGFEHEARTAEEKAKVRQAKEKLKAGDALIVLPAAAGCKLEEAHADVAGLDHDDHGEKKDSDHKHGHDHGHKDDHKDDHKHGHNHGEAGHDEAAHNEYHAEYMFHCDDIAALDRIGVTIFEAFPSTEEVEAAVLTPSGQHAASLDKGNPAIDLSR